MYFSNPEKMPLRIFINNLTFLSFQAPRAYRADITAGFSLTHSVPDWASWRQVASLHNL